MKRIFYLANEIEVIWAIENHALPWVSNLVPPVLWADFVGRVPQGDPFAGDILLDTWKYGGGIKLLTHGNAVSEDTFQYIDQIDYQI